MERTKKKLEWTPEESELLTRLHPMFSSKKWKRISQAFHQNGFQRNQIECREKWINFLDPSINKKDWEDWELEKLYEIHDQVGTRWCVVQKFIGRTQNKIKNRFYGTLRNYIRFIVKHFDETNLCYNYQISKLSPKFLNEMYQGEAQFRFLSSEIKDVVHQMRFKIDKKILGDRMKEMREFYQKLNEIIFKSFEEMPQTEQRRERRINQNQISSIDLEQIAEPHQGYQQEPQPLPITPPTQFIMPCQPDQQLYATTGIYPFQNYLSYAQQNLFYWYV